MLITKSIYERKYRVITIITTIVMIRGVQTIYRDISFGRIIVTAGQLVADMILQCG